MQSKVNEATNDGHFEPLKRDYRLDLEWFAPFDWLRSGWRDLWTFSNGSIFYGVAVFLVSLGVVWTAIEYDAGYILLSAFAGFMIIAPALATGLYEKSRELSQGEWVSLKRMIVTNVNSSGQILYVGAILGLLMVMWVRTAFLLYALFFGMTQFGGFDQIVSSVLTTSTGWLLLGVGGFIGGLFAAFSFAISVYSVPMLLDQKIDAFTAMGTSMAFAWHNVRISIVWGAIIVALFLIAVLTGLVGLIIIYPLLGHATWHAYAATKTASK